jgi:hypothetical protein
VAVLLGQDSSGWTAGTGQLGQDSWGWTAGTGQLGRNSRDRMCGLEDDSRDRTERTGQLGWKKNSQDRTVGKITAERGLKV